MLRGEPSMLFMKLEKPLFFFNATPELLFASSEYLLGLVAPLSERGGVTSIGRSPVVKLIDDRSGGAIGRGSGLVMVCVRGGGGGRR